MRTMAEAIERAIEELGDPAGIGDGRLRSLELVSVMEEVLAEGEGPMRFQPTDWTLVEVIGVWAKFHVRHPDGWAIGQAALHEFSRVAGTDDTWRDQASARWDVLGAVSGVLLQQGVCREDVTAALRMLEDSDSALLTRA